jgi:hypothetical protein
MKAGRIITTAFMLALVPCGLMAFTEDNAKNQIRRAQILLIQIDNNLNIRPYIPYDIYGDGLVELLEARKLFSENKFPRAFYKAAMATIKFETLEIMAEAREVRHRVLVIERDRCKKAPSYESDDDRPSLFTKKGDTRRAILLDSRILAVTGHALSTEGIKILDEVADTITRSGSGIRIVIAGHRGPKDPAQFALYKARLVARFLQDKGVAAERMDLYGVDDEVMETPWGFKKVGRVEIILTGGASQ